jgi:predicted nucleic acid-binding protein
MMPAGSVSGRVTPDEELGITAISAGELVHGATKSQWAVANLARLDVLLAALIKTGVPFTGVQTKPFWCIPPVNL